MSDETDDESVGEITALFGATGQGLNWTHEDDGGWTATLGSGPRRRGAIVSLATLGHSPDPS